MALVAISHHLAQVLRGRSDAAGVSVGENIERALKKFKRKSERTGIIKQLRQRQQFEKPSVINRKKMMKAVYVQHLHTAEEI